MKTVARRAQALSLAGALIVAALGTPACGSSPEPTFYALAPTRGAVQAAAAQPAGTAGAVPRTIKVRRPGLAGYLDRPEIVRRVVAYKLGVAADERWAEPLSIMLGRVLAENVEERVPGSSVFTEDGAITVDPDATVEVDIKRFDVGESGEVTLVAEVAMERGNGHTAAAARAVHLSERPNGESTAALVATMSHLLGQLADQIAGVVRSGS